MQERATGEATDRENQASKPLNFQASNRPCGRRLEEEEEPRHAEEIGEDEEHGEEAGANG